MRILYDNQIFRIQKFGGVSRYCAELMYGLEHDKEFEVLPGKFFSYNKHLSSLGLSNFNYVKGINIPGKKYVEKLIRRREDRYLITSLKSKNFDIYHPTYYNPQHLHVLPREKPLIVTIHDMTYELYYDKQYNKVHQESINKRKIINKAKHIIAVSENTKKDILKLYPELTPDKITVIYHGSSLPENMPISNIRLPEKYVLYVGKRGKYKNFVWLLNSIASSLNDNNISLVCAGGRPFSTEEKKLIGELNVEEKVAYVDISSDQDLATMYKRAACFIYPSSHEGFGIPILEAYSCGCPTLLAESSCFPEIGANGALYFENGNELQLLEQLSRILNDKEKVIELKNSGLARLKDFSWQKTVRQHMDVYKRVFSE
jgi:glycosyltransferase involved in cell wall biosynthesis